MPLKSDLEIAHQANMMPIVEIAKKIGISNENLVPYGHFKAKVDLTFINQQQSPKVGKLILVTAITPTAKGEGKTTTTVGFLTAIFKSI
jgi:formate--tetrahydrofolate ligase